MPQPTLSDVHVNRPLTNISLAWIQEADAFVADKVFPNVPVTKQSDIYAVYPRGYWNRNQMKKRAPGDESAGGGYKVDLTNKYSADVWALHKDIPDQIRANYDAPLQPDMEATEFLDTQYLISREVNWANAYFVTGKWTTEWTGVAASPSTNQFLQWNDPGSTPVEDVRKVKQLIQLSSGGFRPNKLTLGRPVADVLYDHPDIIDRVKAGQTGSSQDTPAKVNARMLAIIFEVDEVLVMDGISNAAAEGQPDANAFIGGKNALLSYSPARPGLMIPSAGYMFSWTGFLGATAIGTRMKSFYLSWRESMRTEIEAAYALQQTSADMGGFFNGAVA